MYWPLRTNTAGARSYRRIPLIIVYNTTVGFIPYIETLLDTRALVFALLHSWVVCQFGIAALDRDVSFFFGAKLELG